MKSRPEVDVTPEHAALLGLLGLSSARQLADQNLAARGLDWDRVWRLAGRHGVLPLIWSRLGTNARNAIPNEAITRLRTLHEGNVRRGLFLTLELQSLLAALTTAGIPAFPFKGPVLAAQLYGQVFARQYGDIDIMIKPNDVGRAQRLLRSLGFVGGLDLSRGLDLAYLAVESHHLFRRAEGALEVELHWQVVPRYAALALDAATLWDRLVAVPVGGQTLYTLAPDDLLLYLCVHGSRHRWERLGWICDVAALIEQSDELDWPALSQRATAVGAQRMLYLGLRLARDLLEAQLPTRVETAVLADGTVARLAREVVTWTLGGEKLPGELGTAFFQLRARERRWDQVRYCTLNAFLPADADYRLVTLPGPLTPLYYGLRPLRLLAKNTRRIWPLRSILAHRSSGK